ncbi:MAG: tRNA (adenosine(37)-N6)-threonylcarbamoyltransferase complex dimerization subunit type 1 TsaB [Actinobacteria bacterium]|nr:tRNA (adenosine(37)-N6)-threonylcarbamoyltransferase complex dimerization subunit type 1 TsaB [Actinomycetota bacterium]MBI3686785.1 tRNA (adenosine(37)-N6)-threonylcarbamoyltransferase complex dimerization subunit type 1 TsaB [Actinomycetota bacterium]
MLTLALDTATPAVTAAVVRVDGTAVRLVSSVVRCDPRRHGELLGPAIRAALDGAGVAFGELAAVVAGLGPGPFTGLRVGLVTAVALADALGVPAYGVCSLDAIGAVAQGGSGRLLVATDARRREVYWAVYDSGGFRVHGPAVDRPAEVATRIADLAVSGVAGAAADSVAVLCGLPVHGPAYPQPAALVAVAADRLRAGAPSEPMIPLYLRRPDAERPGPTKPALAR